MSYQMLSLSDIMNDHDLSSMYIIHRTREMTHLPAVA